VFASYSHKDLAIVKQAGVYGTALRDVYLRDRTTLRSGEDWNENLLNLIDEADVFQLFWSRNSMVSDYVRREWEHALRVARGRDSFVRPTYWEDPMPTSVNPKFPPDDLKKLHFHAFREDPINPPFGDEDYQSASPIGGLTASTAQAPLVPPPAPSAPARQSAEQSERSQQTMYLQAPESTYHPPPAPIWPGVTRPLVPPPAPSAPARQSAAQAVYVPVVPAPQPREYWVLSVIAFLFFFVFGAIAIYFSYQVGHRYRTGNLVGATKASKLARSWGSPGSLSAASQSSCT
jgi:hypothetical protein